MMQTVPSLKAFIVVLALRRINTFAAVIWAISKPADKSLGNRGYLVYPNLFSYMGPVNQARYTIFRIRRLGFRLLLSWCSERPSPIDTRAPDNVERCELSQIRLGCQQCKQKVPPRRLCCVSKCPLERRSLRCPNRSGGATG